MENIINMGRKKLYAIPNKEKGIDILADCEATGGMVRIKMSVSEFERWQSPTRGLIQDIFPMLRNELREILVSGTTPAEFEEIFGKKIPSKEKLEKEFNYEFED